MSLPILYSFRRCPYAMRARLAILLSGQSVELREILLKNKPAQMLAASNKGTVPVLVLDTDSHALKPATIIDESLDIMLWALSINDPLQRLPKPGSQTEQDCFSLIKNNDDDFKHWLDRYKYADRHPEHTPQYYRQQGECFLQTLEDRLGVHQQLLSDKPSLVDYALMPFIRQFAHVDLTWF